MTATHRMMMTTHLTSLAYPLEERAARCEGVVCRRQEERRAARARLGEGGGEGIVLNYPLKKSRHFSNHYGLPVHLGEDDLVLGGRCTRQCLQGMEILVHKTIDNQHFLSTSLTWKPIAPKAPWVSPNPHKRGAYNDHDLRLG